MGSAVGTIYAEELKAIVRGRFAWIGAAVVMLGIGGLAAVASQDTWIDGYGYVAYFLTPIAFLPLAAASIAGPRASGFVESLFTAPVALPAKRETWALLRDLAARNAVTTFLSSHDTQEIRTLCTEISIISKGQLVFSGPTGDLGRTLEDFEDRLIELLTRTRVKDR